MKTSTIVWTLAVLIVLVGVGVYFYVAPTAEAPAPTPNVTVTNTDPLPAGDLAPVPTTPVASSSTSGSINASSTGL
jgi:energy-converting hydrogenase Eha subunit F